MPRLRLKTNLSPDFANSAVLFAARAGALETEHGDAPTDLARGEHRSCSLSAIIAAATFLEAAINELYLEAIDRNPYTFPAGKRTLAELMDHYWTQIEPDSVLSKYQIVLTLAQLLPFPKGEQPYQDTDSLLKLRNALIHYKPEWDTELEVHAALQQRLEKRFEASRFSKPGQAFIPHRCLGFGASRWAANTALSFYRDFMDRAGLPVRPLEAMDAVRKLFDAA